MKNLVLFMAVSIFAVQLGFSQMKNFIDQPYIETSAKADTLIIADRIYLKIFISERDTKDRISLEKQENEMEKVLKGLGINTKENLKLLDLSSNFKTYFLKKQDVMKSKEFSLLVFDALTAGKVIIALEKINISNVEIEKMEHAAIEQVKLKLKENAVKKAKLQAAYLVKGLQQKVGAAIYISDNQVYGYANQNFDQMRISVKSNQEFEPIDIDFKKIKIESEVSVKFKLE